MTNRPWKLQKEYRMFKGKKCEQCLRYKKITLTVHHIDGNKENNRRSNLQTLCEDCHYKIHHPMFYPLKLNENS